MTLNQIKERKRILGYSNEKLSELSGVPLSTVQKVMAGVTRSPRQHTLEALSRALEEPREAYDSPVLYPRLSPNNPGMFVHDTEPAYKIENRVYTIKDIEELPEGIRAELIDGKIYYMASPSRTHQKICGEMYLAVANYIRAKGGSCEVYIPPFGVYLTCNEYDYVEPDLSVICDMDKLDDKGCHGAPDWVLEVMSPSSRRMDNVIKLNKYRNSGVREYWVIHPDKRIIQIHIFEGAEDVFIYSFDDQVPSYIYPDLTIRLADYV